MLSSLDHPFVVSIEAVFKDRSKTERDWHKAYIQFPYFEVLHYAEFDVLLLPFWWVVFSLVFLTTCGQLLFSIKNGTLRDFFNSPDRTPWELECIFRQIVQGLGYIHSQRIVHR